MTAIPLDDPSVFCETTDALDALERVEAEARSVAPATPGRYLAIAGGERPRLLELARPITHLGRGFGATFQLEDRGVSRRHAIVTQRRESVRILDDRSSNGTFVNGHRITEAQLRDGDVIVLGRVVLVYREVHD